VRNGRGNAVRNLGLQELVVLREDTADVPSVAGVPYLAAMKYAAASHSFQNLLSSKHRVVPTLQGY
jgi:hypothetical protein